MTGAVFYVMELVDGEVLRDEDDVEARFDEPGRRRVGEALVDTLADLHAVDFDAAGLGELGRREGYAERQLKRWQRQWEGSKTRELPVMDETHALLSARVPAAARHRDRARRLPAGQRDRRAVGRRRRGGRLGAVHARRPARRPRAAASSTGPQPGDAVIPLTRAPTLAPGFPPREELAARYAERSGRDISSLDFFVALGYWKLAAILEGVYARYSRGRLREDGRRLPSRSARSSSSSPARPTTRRGDWIETMAEPTSSRSSWREARASGWRR